MIRPLQTLHVDLGRDWRGGQGQALLLMEGLRSRGHGVELVAAEGGALAQKARQAGVRVHAISKSFPRVAATWRLRALDADVVHCHDAHGLSAAWLAGVQRRTKLVASRRLAYPLAGGRLGLARYRGAHRIVAVSRFVQDSVLASGIAAGRVTVVYDGVPVPQRPTQEQCAAARALWSGDVRLPLVGCVGYLLPEKGQELLVRAVPLLTGAAAQSRVVLAGDGPERARLEVLARDLGVTDKIRFAGHVEDVALVYRALDVFVFPSLAEPLGSSLLAAMSHALPVVGVASGAVPELIRHGANGLLASQPDPREIAAAVDRLLSQPAWAHELGETARATVESRFTAEHMVDGTLAVYAAL